MLSQEPSITEHAFSRALDRMGLRRDSFADWVSATWRDWIPVSARWASDRGVKCSDADGTRLMATPWTPAVGVVLYVSPDHAIKTLYPFDQASRVFGSSGADVPEKVHAFAKSALQLKAALGLPEGQMMPRATEAVITALTERSIDTDGVVRVLRSTSRNRDDTLRTVLRGWASA